jgi:hypothetical protein
MSPNESTTPTRPASAPGRDPHWSTVLLAIGGTIAGAVLVSVAGTALLT